MKQLKYTYSFLAILLLLIPGILSSCLKDELTQTEERGLIIMSLDGVTTRAAGDTINSGDAVITKVRVFVFVGQMLEVNKVFTVGDSTFINPFVLNVKTGPKTVYVVANERSGMTTDLNNVTTQQQLKNIVTPQTDPGSLPFATPLTMVGSKEVVVMPTVDPDNPTEVTVALTRLMARVNLRLIKGDTPADIIIKSVRLLRGTTKSALIEGQPVPGQVYGNNIYTGAGEYELTTSGVDAWTGATPMYLYENPGSVLDTANRATYLVIEARYNGVNTRYQAYVNDSTATSTSAGYNPHPYAIKRNHMYNIEATISNIGEFDGLTLSTFVMPWNKLESALTYDRIYETSLDPQPTLENKNYYVTQKTDSITFTFTITNPYGAAWTPQFTNPDYFDVTVTPGTSPYELGTYTISISPKYDPNNEERVTEFYINVGWAGSASGYVEIPLLSGTALIGTGYRIVITQLAVTP